MTVYFTTYILRRLQEWIHIGLEGGVLLPLLTEDHLLLSLDDHPLTVLQVEGGSAVIVQEVRTITRQVDWSITI